MLRFHPQVGQIFMCDFRGMVVPETVYTISPNRLDLIYKNGLNKLYIFI